MPDGPQVEALLERIQRLEDERAIVATLHRYAHAIDSGDEAGWVDCFAEDGGFRASGRDAAHTAFDVAGRPALRAFIAQHSRPPHGHHQHHVTEPVVAIDGDRATCRSAMFVFMEHDDRPVLRVMGRYVDQLVRGVDGRWRFALRVAEIDTMRAGLPPLAYALTPEGDPTGH